MWKLTEKIPDFTYWKSVFLNIFCSVLTMLLDAPEIFQEDLVQTHPNHWELVLGAMVCPTKNLDFSKIFLTNRILPNQAKSWKWVMFKKEAYYNHILSCQFLLATDIDISSF